MAPPKATPETRREHYGTRGRPLSDWEALRELWYGSETVREASNDAFTRFEKHAYAQPATQREAEGRALTELIWAEMRALGYEVETDPVHFTKSATSSSPPPASEPAPRPAATAPARDAGAAQPTNWVAAAVAAALTLVLLALARRWRTRRD